MESLLWYCKVMMSLSGWHLKNRIVLNQSVDKSIYGGIAKLDPAKDCLKKTLDWTGCTGESPSSKPETAI